MISNQGLLQRIFAEECGMRNLRNHILKIEKFDKTEENNKKPLMEI